MTDIMEGFVALNPIYLKPYDEKALRQLYEAAVKRQIEIRAEPFPYNNTELIRSRNLKLQRLSTAVVVIRNYAREKRFALEAAEARPRKRTAYF